MKYTVVSTFNAQGYDSYGRRMIETFLKTWPAEVDLCIYTEQCSVGITAPNLHIRDLAQCSPSLTAFKQRWQNVPYATGNVESIPRLAARSDSKKSFKWDAIRFSHKVYSIGHCADHCNADTLLWMDADMVCHSPITLADLDRMCPTAYDICFLGRGKKFSECGLYAMNLNSAATKKFVKDFVGMYDQGSIFNLDEWHDSYVFDHVRRANNLKGLDWSGHQFNGEGHPLINGEWGRWLDHLKGDRKQTGRSKAKDLRVQRTETYWRM